MKYSTFYKPEDVQIGYNSNLIYHIVCVDCNDIVKSISCEQSVIHKIMKNDYCVFTYINANIKKFLQLKRYKV